MIRHRTIAAVGSVLLAGAAALHAAPADAEARIDAVLDDWHAAAAAADFERYFGKFAPHAVFIGTDATERWTLEEFRAFARPYFERGKAWSFRAVERNVRVSGDVAWFDEKLATEKLGACRGSGVLVRSDGGWKIVHYVLSLAVPNALVDDVVSRIAAEESAPAPAPPP